MKKLFLIAVLLLFTVGVFAQDTGPPLIEQPKTELAQSDNTILDLPNPMKQREEPFLGPGEYIGILVVVRPYKDSYYPLMTGKIRTRALEQLYRNPDRIGSLIHYTETMDILWDPLE